MACLEGLRKRHMVDVKARERQLRERLAELEGRLHRIDDHLGQPPDKDWEDNAIESEMDQVLEGLGHAGNTEIQAIYAALARLKAGTYGVCVRCGEDISEDRLDVLPHTPLCQTCAREVGQKHVA
jgi:RNA polymerase-binding transcription factor DksA